MVNWYYSNILLITIVQNWEHPLVTGHSVRLPVHHPFQTACVCFFVQSAGKTRSQDEPTNFWCLRPVAGFCADLRLVFCITEQDRVQPKHCQINGVSPAGTYSYITESWSKLNPTTKFKHKGHSCENILKTCDHMWNEKQHSCHVKPAGSGADTIIYLCHILVAVTLGKCAVFAVCKSGTYVPNISAAYNNLPQIPLIIIHITYIPPITWIPRNTDPCSF